MKKIDLRGEWKLYDEHGVMHVAHVPGCVHTDLFAKEEMFYEKNSAICRFIEEQDWKYAKNFCVDNLLPNPILVLEGLDTYCEIFLNHQKIGSADNMFIPHRFSVEGVLKEGENLIEIQFLSPMKAVAGKPKLSGSFVSERLHTRRMQCTYGWDWVDRFVTCGIYRPVSIVFENDMSVKDVYVYTTNVDEYSAQVKVLEHFKCFERGGLVQTTILDPKGEKVYYRECYCKEEEHALYVDITEPQLWYPRPYGEQPLYELVVSVGEEVFRQKFGIRTVKILQLPDKDEEVIAKCRMLQETESGKEYDGNTEYSGFIPVINGTKIFCTGANWVPCEPFPSEESEEKITSLLERATKAGVNMIRVWGGGLFEKEHFYNECDRLGILVTQDFLMACGEYPEEEEVFQTHLTKEAEYAAVYLRNHPSLVWWTGDNENAVMGHDAECNYPGRCAGRKVIAPVLERLDYNRRFLSSSPYGGKMYASKTVGTTHNTQFLGSVFRYLEKKTLSDYREYWEGYTARFIAEEPIMGAVSRQTLREFISEEHEKNYDMWLYHTKTNPALNIELMDIMVDFAEKLFGGYADWEERNFKLRYLQYEWVRFTLGIARSNLWFNSGIVYWMLNDCWPAAIGWSVLDYYTREKAGYYALQTYGQPTSVYIKKGKNGYILHISNILKSPIECKVQAYVLDMNTGRKTELFRDEILLASGCQIRELHISLQENEILIATAETNQTTQSNWYKEGIPSLRRTGDVHWELTDEGVIVWADRYVHAVEIEGAENLSDNYFSLLPGERVCVTYSNKENIQVNGYTF